MTELSAIYLINFYIISKLNRITGKIGLFINNNIFQMMWKDIIKTLIIIY